MRCALIEAEKANYPITWMCDQLNVPRSSFYAWRAAAGTVTATVARRRVLAQLVAKVFDDSRGTYGCRRVAAELNRKGHPASVGLVADLMRELELVACQPRSYKTTTIAGDQPVESPDLIEREFSAPAPGQRLVGDITYLRTGEGWLYLATVIDLATRMVVGWQLAEHMRTSLATDALAMAITGGHAPAGVIFHSDRGCQPRLNRSTQHLDREVCNGARARLGGGNDGQAADAVTGSPTGCPQGTSAVVLVGDLTRGHKYGCRARGRRVAGRW
jgi:putative transposase